MNVPTNPNGNLPAVAPVQDRDYGAITERVVIQGDLSKLTADERTRYYLDVCRSVGLNPLTQPFDYITFQGKLKLYAKACAAEQLRENRDISIAIVSKEKIGELYSVTARASTPKGRQDESTGVVSLAGLKGDELANRLMKAETKAKRRVTLSICGLGMLDESEVETLSTSDRVESSKPAALEPKRSLEAKATPDQLHLLIEFAAHFEWEPETIRKRLQKAYRVDRFEDLTREQARQLGDGLCAKYGPPETWDMDSSEAAEERAAIQQEGART
ncbi:MAG: hypothetical protein ACREJC_01075 [Tepidisphaeraceae bacterium]